MSYFENLMDSQKPWEGKGKLFTELSDESKEEFNLAENGELTRLYSVGHSSSALVVNIFEYWRKNKQYNIIANALGIDNKKIDKIVYEKSFPIDPEWRKPPRPDVCFYIEGDDSIIAIESKFTEPYYPNKEKKELSGGYFEKMRDNGLKNLVDYANNLKNTRYFDSIQMIKHIIGLKTSKKTFELLYLYYPHLTDQEEQGIFEEEIDKFKEFCKKDKIEFRQIKWTYLIKKLYDVIQKTPDNLDNQHKNYIDYIGKKYIDAVPGNPTFNQSA